MPWSEGPWSRLIEGFWDYDFSPAFNPGFEIQETGHEFRVIFEVPGVKRKDIHFDLEGGMLRVRGVRKAPLMKEGECCCCSGLSYGSFERTFALPDSARNGKIRTSLHEGLFELIVPKTAMVKGKAAKKR
jgi:HSP20 family protein